jgi:hypothetical protein
MAKDRGTVKVRMKVGITGDFENGGPVERGDIVEIDARNVERYVRAGYIQPVGDEPLGEPYQPYVPKGGK